MKRWISIPNLLALVSGCLMIAAMLLPWWSLSIQYTGKTDLYPYLISGPVSELVGYKRSPQMFALSIVLGVCILLCFMGSSIRGTAGRVLLGIAGALVLLATWRFLDRVAGVASRFGIPLQGSGTATYMGFSPVKVKAEIRPGAYLIALGGALCLMAGILHHRLRPGSKQPN